MVNRVQRTLKCKDDALSAPFTGALMCDSYCTVVDASQEAIREIKD